MTRETLRAPPAPASPSPASRAARAFARDNANIATSGNSSKPLQYAQCGRTKVMFGMR